MKLSRRACALAAYVAAGATVLQASGEDFHMRVYATSSCWEDTEKDFIEARFPAQTDLCNQAQTCFCATGEDIVRGLRGPSKAKVALEFCFQEGSLEVKFFKGASACDVSPDGVVPIVDRGNGFFLEEGCTFIRPVTGGKLTPLNGGKLTAEGWVVKAINIDPFTTCAARRGVEGGSVFPFRGGDGYFDLGIYDGLAQCESLPDRRQAYDDPANFKYTPKGEDYTRCDICGSGEGISDRYPLNPTASWQIKYIGPVQCVSLYKRWLMEGIDGPTCFVTQTEAARRCSCARRGGRRYGFRFKGELDMCDETKSCICVPGTDIIASKLKRALGISLKPNGGGMEVKLFDGVDTCVGNPAAVFQLQGSQVDDFMNGKCMSGRNGGNTAPLYLVKEAVENIKCLKERLALGVSASSSCPSPTPSSPSPSPPRPNPSLPEDGVNNPADEPADSSAIRSAMNGLRCTNGQAPLSWSADLEKKAKLETESKEEFKRDIEGEQRSLYILDVSSPKVIVEAMYTKGEGQKPGKNSDSRGLYDIITAWESGTAMACARVGPDSEKKKIKEPGWICFFAEVDPATLASEDCGMYPSASSTADRSDADKESALEALNRMEEDGDTGGTIGAGKDIGGRSATLSALVAGCWCAVAAALF